MSKITKKTISIFALFAGLAAAVPAMGQESAKVLGTFKDWEVHSFRQDGGRVCNMFSRPIKSEGKYSQRGDVYLFVSNRPSDSVTDEFSVQIGYTFKTAASAYAIVGKRQFELFTQDDFAWLLSDKEQTALIRSMRAGSEVTVIGISSRGTKTTDTFSLSGFTAAHNLIHSACK